MSRPTRRVLLSALFLASLQLSACMTSCDAGNGEEGAPCESLLEDDAPCDRGLYCVRGTCVDVCEKCALGEECMVRESEGFSSDPDVTCGHGPGSFCIPGHTQCDPGLLCTSESAQNDRWSCMPVEPEPEPAPLPQFDQVCSSAETLWQTWIDGTCLTKQAQVGDASSTRYLDASGTEYQYFADSGPQCARIRAAITAERYALRSGALTACVALLSGRLANCLPPELAECGALVGLVNPGGGCFAEEVPGVNACTRGTCSNACPGGECEHFASEGQACDTYSDCQAGLECTASKRCENVCAKCEPGVDCTVVRPDGEPDAQAVCGHGLRAPCSPSSPCDPGLECVLGEHLESAFCEEPYACTTDPKCSPLDCLRNTCPPAKNLDEACRYDATQELADCAPGLVCDALSNTCKEAPKTDEACTFTRMPCESPDESCSRPDLSFCEELSDGCTCQRRGLVGTLCQGDQECDPGLVCGHQLRCKLPAQASEACEYTSDCADGLACLNRTCSVEGTKRGERCEDKECVRGLACLSRHDGTKACVTHDTPWEEPLCYPR